MVSPVIKPQQHQTFFSGSVAGDSGYVPRCSEIAVPGPDGPFVASGAGDSSEEGRGSIARHSTRGAPKISLAGLQAKAVETIRPNAAPIFVEAKCPRNLAM